MKRTELKEIKSLDIKELTSRIGNAKKELAGLVIERSGQSSAKGAKDVKLAAKKRTDIAQIWTILRQKQLLEELGSRVQSIEPSGEKGIKKQKGDSNNEKKVRDGQSGNVTKSKKRGRTGLSKKNK